MINDNIDHLLSLDEHNIKAADIERSRSLVRLVVDRLGEEILWSGMHGSIQGAYDGWFMNLDKCVAKAAELGKKPRELFADLLIEVLRGQHGGAKQS